MENLIFNSNYILHEDYEKYWLNPSYTLMLQLELRFWYTAMTLDLYILNVNVII